MRQCEIVKQIYRQAVRHYYRSIANIYSILLVMAVYFILLCHIISLHLCYAYRALVVIPTPSKSHAILGHGIVRQLLKDGNEVTYITAFEYDKSAPPNLQQISVSSTMEALPQTFISLEHILNKSMIVNEHYSTKKLFTDIAIKAAENKDLQELLSDPKQHFDVVILEYLGNDLLAGIAAVFDCPLIWSSPMEVNADILSRVDKIPNPALIPGLLSTNIPPLTFRQRIEELWSLLEGYYWDYTQFDDIQSKAYYSLIAPFIIKRGRKPPTFNEIRYSGSMVLGNSHVSMGQAFSLPQNYKHVGGYHIDEVTEPLSEDLKTLLDNSKYGVIYFSMGSNLKSTEWPEQIKKGLLDVFGRLKQTVLWKFEQPLLNLPKNVHVLKWAPQAGILSHKNCIAFITHGGLLSTTEVLHFGVPIIGIPVIGDQFVNIERAVSKGFALRVDLSYDLVEDLQTAIQEVIVNPVYRKKAKEWSFIYHDRPLKPSQELSHWVNHVVRTHGAQHLRSPAFYLSLYQILYLDLLVPICITLFLIYLLIKLTRKNKYKKIK